jgi:hypothetical protein
MDITQEEQGLEQFISDVLRRAKAAEEAHNKKSVVFVSDGHCYETFHWNEVDKTLQIDTCIAMLDAAADVDGNADVYDVGQRLGGNGVPSYWIETDLGE